MLLQLLKRWPQLLEQRQFPFGNRLDQCDRAECVDLAGFAVESVSDLTGNGHARASRCLVLVLIWRSYRFI